MTAVLLVLLVLSNTASQASAPRPVRVAGPGYEGAIVTAEELLATDSRHLTKPASLWTPTEADIREAEERLAHYLKSPEAPAFLRDTHIQSELTRYYRQYWGRVVRGQRQVLMQFFHAESSAGQRGLWHQGPLVVMGGGYQFFRVRYHVQTKRFSDLQMNAPE